MSYRISITKKAMKFIEKQPPDMQKAILKAVFLLPDGDVKPLKGSKGVYRLRVGSYRAIYTMDNHEINVVNVGNRGQVYKSL